MSDSCIHTPVSHAEYINTLLEAWNAVRRNEEELFYLYECGMGALLLGKCDSH